jgi:hypothetical protein
MPEQARVVAEKLLARLLLRIAGALRKDADDAADLGRPRARDARDGECACGGSEDRGQDTDGGRLARAVRAEKAEHRSARNFELEPVHRDERPVALGEPPSFDRSRHEPEGRGRR